MTDNAEDPFVVLQEPELRPLEQRVADKVAIHLNADGAVRVALLEAIRAEAKLMTDIGTDAQLPLNAAEKAAAKIVGYALDHIAERWEHDAAVGFDRKNMRFITSPRD